MSRVPRVTRTFEIKRNNITQGYDLTFNLTYFDVKEGKARRIGKIFGGTEILNGDSFGHINDFEIDEQFSNKKLCRPFFRYALQTIKGMLPTNASIHFSLSSQGTDKIFSYVRAAKDNNFKIVVQDSLYWKDKQFHGLNEAYCKYYSTVQLTEKKEYKSDIVFVNPANNIQKEEKKEEK